MSLRKKIIIGVGVTVLVLIAGNVILNIIARDNDEDYDDEDLEFDECHMKCEGPLDETSDEGKSETVSEEKTDEDKDE